MNVAPVGARDHRAGQVRAFLAVRDELGVGGVELTPLEQRRHEGLAQRDVDDRGRGDEVRHPAQSALDPAGELVRVAKGIGIELGG